MYFFRLLDVLRGRLPEARRLVGDDRFHNLVTGLSARAPAGALRRCASWAARCPASSQTTRWRGEFAAAPDLARLEWARVDVFDAADSAVLERDALLSRAAAAPDAFRFRLVAAARLLRLRGAALARWKLGEPAAHGKEADLQSRPTRSPQGRAAAAQRGAAEQSVGPREGLKASEGGPLHGLDAVDVLVWRRQFSVLHRSLDADEARCLAALHDADQTLAGVAEELAAALPADAQPQQAAARLALLLERWTRDALLAAA